MVGFIAGPRMFPDSSGYIAFDQSRTILYPIVIASFRGLFGSYGLNVLAVVQLIAVLLATQRLSQWVISVFNLPKRYVLWVFLFGMIPWVMGKELRFATSILTEPLTYALYVPFMISLFQSSKKHSHLTLGLSVILMMLMLLIRPQMLFVLAGFIVWALYVYFYKKDRKKAVLGVLISFICAGMALQINDLAYQYVFNKGRALDKSFSYAIALTPLVYMAEQKTIDHIENTKVRKSLIELNRLLKKKCLFVSSRFDDACGPIAQKDHFRWSYDRIFYGTYASVFAKYNLDYKTIYMTLLPIVLKYQLGDVFQHIQRSLIYVGMHGFYFSCVLFFLFIAVVRFFYKHEHEVARWSLFLALLYIANLIFISLCTFHFYRYMFYTEIPITMTAFGFYLVWLKGKEEEEMSSQVVSVMGMNRS